MKQNGQQRIVRHSLVKKGCQMSTHQSLQDSKNQTFFRKMSSSSLRHYTNIDRLIDDIKITPNKANSQQDHLKTILDTLDQLKVNPSILDQIRTIQLLIESIAKKIHQNPLKEIQIWSNVQEKETIKNLQSKNSHVSPYSKLDNSNSHILYANLNLRNTQKSVSSYQDSIQTLIKSCNLQDEDQNTQMQKLNSEIKMLENMLKVKTVGQSTKKTNPSQMLMKDKLLSSNKSKIIDREIKSVGVKINSNLKQYDLTLNAKNSKYDKETVKRGRQLNSN